MTTLRSILTTATLAGALALAAQPAEAFGRGGGGFHGGGGGFHGGGGGGWHGGGGGWHGGGGGWRGGGGWHGGYGRWGGGGWGGGWGGWGWGVPMVGFGAVAPYYYDDYYDPGYRACRLRRVKVQTPYGLRWRTLRYCY